jgi:hypothetical protein
MLLRAHILEYRLSYWTEPRNQDSEWEADTQVDAEMVNLDFQGGYVLESAAGGVIRKLQCVTLFVRIALCLASPSNHLTIS